MDQGFRIAIDRFLPDLFQNQEKDTTAIERRKRQKINDRQIEREQRRKIQ